MELATMDSNDAAAEPVKRLIDFDRADVITPMIYPPRPRLVVSGTLPHPMEVSLVPLTYVSRPQWWGIQVVGATGPEPSAMPAITSIPYQVELDLEGITGTEGVEVIGASRTERIAVPH
jgi:hypothetical protein